jgi:hypothetical protein
MLCDVDILKLLRFETLTYCDVLHLVTFTCWNYYVLKLLCLETITFNDASLSDVNVVCYYVLSQ